MKVARDFERLYQADPDPWHIGEAISPRYDSYYEMIRPFAHGSILDIGCGFGAFLARFHSQGTSLDGVEVSRTAIRKGAERFPFISFHEGSAAALDSIATLRDRYFNLIICSDLIYYLNDRAKIELLEWVGRHLAEDGVIFLAAWCPGGKYLTSRELTDLVQQHCIISHLVDFSDSQHLALVANRRRKLIAITVDYETWHPIPEGKCIDWDVDVFGPTQRLLELFETNGVKATFFAEIGEYFWLQANVPKLAIRMEEQWREAVLRGHDVQLHVHPNWLPELGSKCVDGEWSWDWKKAKIDAYPGDLSVLIRKCKVALESVICVVNPEYRVTTFRAGGYQAQPFERLSRALIENGIIADSSVHPGGKNNDRSYDYSHAYSTHQPYYADLLDPQLKAIPTEERIIELPIFTPEPGRRWFIDGNEGAILAKRLIRYEGQWKRNRSVRTRRIVERLKGLAATLYGVATPFRRWVNLILPRAVAHSFTGNQDIRVDGHRYFVAIGHTKADLRYDRLEESLRTLKRVLNVEFITVTEMAKLAQSDLSKIRRSSQKEISFQVQRESKAILGEERNFSQSDYLQQMIPLDIDRVLDFGCGAGYWSSRIAELYPWVTVLGIDAGAEFIAKAKLKHRSHRVDFFQGDFLKLPLPNASFDCVYADNTLEHSFDVDAALAEIYRVLKDGGALVAAIPVDGLNPGKNCDNHTWKTIGSAALERLRRAGFTNISFEEVDTYRRLGMAPFPPSNDRMLYLRAWKVEGGDSPLKRALRAMHWIYNQVQPTQSNLSLNANEIILAGHAFCIGYTIALGELLRKEGYHVTWVTMLAENHPRGRGKRMVDSHEVLETSIDGQYYVLDPTANTVFPCSLNDLLRKPEIANLYANADDRCRERSFDLYNTSFWYERVKRISRRKNPKKMHFFSKVQ